MDKLVNRFEKRKAILRKLFDKTVQFIDRMSPFELKQLEENVQDYQSLLQGHKISLQHRDYPVLVIGDDNQGKKDMIQLLLSDSCPVLNQIYNYGFCYWLSYDHHTYVEIERRIDEETTTTTTIHLQAENDDDDDFHQQIEQYITKYEKDIAIFKIYRPIKELKDGIQYISYPWSIQLPTVCDQFISCLSTAFAVIFVFQMNEVVNIDLVKQINTLLQQTWNREKGSLGHYSLDSTIFICNTRIEDLKEQDITSTKEYYCQKMSHYWPNCTQEQFLVVNLTAAFNDYQLGFLAEEYTEIMTHLQKFISDNLRYKLELSSRWLQYLLSRISFNYQFQYAMSQKSLELRKLIVDELQGRLNSMQMKTNRDEIKKQLHTNILYRQQEVVHDLWKLIQSDDTANILQESLQDKIVNQPDLTYRQFIHDAKTAVVSLIAGREDVQDYFNQLGYYLIEQYKKELFGLQSLLENFERGSLCQLDVLQDYNEANFAYDDQYACQEKVIFDLVSPLWVPVHFSANLIHSVEEISLDEVDQIVANHVNLDNPKLIKKKLITWFKSRVFSIMENSFQRAKVFEAMTVIMKPVTDSFDRYFRDIPYLFQFYRNLLQHTLLLDDISDTDRHGHESLSQLLSSSQHLSSLVMLFNIKYVRQTEFHSRQLSGYDKNCLLDRNSIAQYSTCQLNSKNLPVLPITLKIFNNKVSTGNIAKLLSQEEALRKLKHRNIVMFYGLISLEDRIDNFTLACEICHCTLRKFFDYQNDYTPADFPFQFEKQQRAYRKIKFFAIQIASGLSYIHSACYVHPDLQLEYIMLSIDYNIKLCNPCVVHDSEGAMNSIHGQKSHIYPAPEYLAGHLYNSKCDMYSYGLILYEMWYNKSLMDLLTGPTGMTKEAIDKLTQGIHFDFDTYPPPPDLWQYLITNCLEIDPTRRLSSSACYKALEFRKDYDDSEVNSSSTMC